jgi:hypothetical protein
MEKLHCEHPKKIIPFKLSTLEGGNGKDANNGANISYQKHEEI